MKDIEASAPRESYKEQEKRFNTNIDRMSNLYIDNQTKSKQDPNHLFVLDRETAAQYEVPELTMPIGECDVALAGYWHEMAYFDAHEQQIRNHIRGADILVTELAQLSGGQLKDKTIDVPDDFFEEIERVAWPNVPIVCVDPHLHGSIDRKALELRDSEFTKAKGVTFLSALALTSAALGVGAYQEFKARADAVESEVGTENSDRRTMSRRSFLVGGASAAVASVSFASLFGTYLNAQPQPYHRRAESPVGAVLLDKEDYRDVATAYTILTAARTLPKGSRVAVTYGAGHMRSLKHYLDNPNELAIKMALYKSMYEGIIPEPQVQVPIGSSIDRRHPENSWDTIPMSAFLEEKRGL